MADENIADAWKEAEKLLNKGKTVGALDLLRDVDPEGKEATTLRIAGQATYMQASKSGSHAEYRKAAKLLRDAVKMNPRDKQSNALNNQILNEMQDKRISVTVFPRLSNEGVPTPAGLFAVTAGLLLILAALQFAQSDDEFEDGEAVMRVTWTDSDGVLHDEMITIALHRAEAPLHVENFMLLAEEGKYDSVIFHRVIEGFMIQGGDFEYNTGSGGYTAKWYGYCNGKTTNNDGVEYTRDTCQINQWSLPGEHENGLKHKPGALAAAHAGLNTDGSQFYIVPTGSEPTWLDWEEGKDCSSSSCHTVYGTVTDGLQHIDAIAGVDTGQNDKPVNDVTIKSIEITDDGVKDSTPWYQFW
ncbi:MAG: peptidylprolyl isomerase [Candidatus Poseidoniales archaeon]|nr:MAG: peptidylprolyl isomerase [Candidatus Poseidoniales archaeon]